MGEQCLHALKCPMGPLPLCSSKKVRPFSLGLFSSSAPIEFVSVRYDPYKPSLWSAKVPLNLVK